MLCCTVSGGKFISADFRNDFDRLVNAILFNVTIEGFATRGPVRTVEVLYKCVSMIVISLCDRNTYILCMASSWAAAPHCGDLSLRVVCTRYMSANHQLTVVLSSLTVV